MSQQVNALIRFAAKNGPAHLNYPLALGLASVYVATVEPT